MLHWVIIREKQIIQNLVLTAHEICHKWREDVDENTRIVREKKRLFHFYSNEYKTDEYKRWHQMKFLYSGVKNIKKQTLSGLKTRECNHQAFIHHSSLLRIGEKKFFASVGTTTLFLCLPTLVIFKKNNIIPSVSFTEFCWKVHISWIISCAQKWLVVVMTNTVNECTWAS